MSLVHLLSLALLATSGADAASANRAPHGKVPFLAQADVGNPASDLRGTEWLLTWLRDMEVDPKIGSSLGFDENGSAFGNGGCNRFKGAAEIEGGALKFGDLASTMMACEEPNSKQEAAFHAALAETAGFRVEEGNLLLLDGEEEAVARLSPAN